MDIRPVPTLTLDTSCVSALANPSSTDDAAEVAALGGIIDMARAGTVKLQLTASYERDFERWKDEPRRAERLDWLAEAPPIPRVGGIARFDVSVYDGPDVYASDEEVELDRQLRANLLPSRAGQSTPAHEDEPGAAARRFSDIDHLIAHARSGALMFVTLDDKTILRRRDALAALGIVVGLPSDALAAVPGLL
jgi:hypothetical protein